MNENKSKGNFEGNSKKRKGIRIKLTTAGWKASSFSLHLATLVSGAQHFISITYLLRTSKYFYIFFQKFHLTPRFDDPLLEWKIESCLNRFRRRKKPNSKVSLKKQ